MERISRRDFIRDSAFLAGLLFLDGCSSKLPVIEPTSTSSEQAKNIQPTATIGTPSKVEPTATIDTTQFFFNGNFNKNMFLDKWMVTRGDPKINGGFLTLADADIQSKDMFIGGVLQGVIFSSNWKPQNEFTDSSFGFETWAGQNKQCHCGILFKANGHLAVLRSQSDVADKCIGDPQYQAYPPIPNWDVIRAYTAVSFSLTWRTDEVILQVSGNGQTSQVSYSGRAIPNLPLHLRFYAQYGEKYKADEIVLSQK